MWADPDLDGLGVEGDAGVSGGDEQASPVRVAAGPGGLAEGRVGDGFGDLFGVGGGCGAGDVEVDEVGDALAVVDDLVGEGVAYEGQGVGEGGVNSGGVFAAEADAAGPAGDEQDGVVGGGVAVDGDAVEAALV